MKADKICRQLNRCVVRLGCQRCADVRCYQCFLFGRLNQRRLELWDIDAGNAFIFACGQSLFAKLHRRSMLQWCCAIFAGFGDFSNHVVYVGCRWLCTMCMKPTRELREEGSPWFSRALCMCSFLRLSSSCARPTSKDGHMHDERFSRSEVCTVEPTSQPTLVTSVCGLAMGFPAGMWTG